MPTALLRNVRAVLPHPQLDARGFLHFMEHPIAGRIGYPNFPMRFSGEYPTLYAHMADLVRERRSDVDLSPMIHLADAMTLGDRRIVKPFNW